MIRKASSKKKKKFNSLKIGTKQRENSVLDWVGKIQILENILVSNLILYTAPHATAKMRYNADIVLAKL